MIEKKLLFLTGNANKLKEAKEILGEDYLIENKKVDLMEIQSMDMQEIVAYKLQEAYAFVKRPVFCEDTGLFIEQLNGFPGPLVKFYSTHLGCEGIAKQTGGSPAYAQTIIGYHDGNTCHFFIGKIAGTIAKTPQGTGFGWDPVFIPKGYQKSFAEIEVTEKNRISHRGKAFQQFSSYLKQL